MRAFLGVALLCLLTSASAQSFNLKRDKQDSPKQNPSKQSPSKHNHNPSNQNPSNQNPSNQNPSNQNPSNQNPSKGEGAPPSSPDWGSPCKEDADCGHHPPDGKCGMPFSNKKDQNSITNDALLRYGHPTCNNGGCDCTVDASDTKDLKFLCADIIHNMGKKSFVCTNACVQGDNGLTCDGYYTNCADTDDGKSNCPDAKSASNMCGSSGN